MAGGWGALYKNKNEGNENKIMLGYLNCTMFKIDRNDENKTQRLYRCCSNYTLSKLIMDNGFDDLWRKERLGSPPYTKGSLPRILDRQVLYWYKIANNTKIDYLMVSFTNRYNAISIDRLPWKTKIGKHSWYFNNSFVCKSEVSSATKIILFLLKTH